VPGAPFLALFARSGCNGWGLPEEALRPNSVKKQPLDIIVQERTWFAEAA
jgi:hypothetical protein